MGAFAEEVDAGSTSGSSVALNAAAPPGGGGGRLGGLCMATISSFFAFAVAFGFAFAFVFALVAVSSFARFVQEFCSSMGTMAAGVEAAVSMLSGGVAKNSSLSDGGFLPLILVRDGP